MRANGREVIMTNGFLSDPRIVTMTRYTKTTPTAIEHEDGLETFLDICEYPRRW